MIGFPPRNEPNAFFADLIIYYRDVLRRPTSSTYVDPEGVNVWLTEYFRFSLNGCTHSESVARTLREIQLGSTEPTCGAETPTFPPRNLPFDFQNQLELAYRDVLRRPAIQSFIDSEGANVWLAQYLRFRVSTCDHVTARAKVFTEIGGGGVQPDCTPPPPPPPPPPTGNNPPPTGNNPPPTTGTPAVLNNGNAVTWVSKQTTTGNAAYSPLDIRISQSGGNLSGSNRDNNREVDVSTTGTIDSAGNVRLVCTLTNGGSPRQVLTFTGRVSPLSGNNQTISGTYSGTGSGPLETGTFIMTHN